VLVDELGSGTDPSEGAALAAGVLDAQLHFKDPIESPIEFLAFAAALLTRFADGARLTFATSHFAELKAMAAADDRFVSSAVEFDTVKLKPTYRLLWGEVVRA
jgi:DNA mismatch repair protein MutS2